MNYSIAIRAINGLSASGVLALTFVIVGTLRDEGSSVPGSIATNPLTY